MSASEVLAQSAGGPSPGADLVELTKPRITVMVMVTVGIGALLASEGGPPVALLVHVVLGTAMVSGGASALNQILEREVDRRMRRTADRPLPAGRMRSEVAWGFSGALVAVGLLYLELAVNGLTALLGLAALVSYVAIYTPLKRASSLATLVGAVPGAIPPMMGWAALTGGLEAGAWALFGILFLWQLPHFLAIAWLCREDYGVAGFPMLPVTDHDGRRTGRQMVLYSLALMPVSLVPTLLGLTGRAYLVGAAILGALLVVFALNFLVSPSRAAARRVMLYSVVYLPAVLAVMVLDRVL
ncbi:MAG: heme o synthase [Thermoanaerobaculia bacterium]|nr:heme o synthase [Thermoanaerobaculia bacterium]